MRQLLLADRNSALGESFGGCRVPHGKLWKYRFRHAVGPPYADQTVAKGGHKAPNEIGQQYVGQKSSP